MVGQMERKEKEVAFLNKNGGKKWKGIAS